VFAQIISETHSPHYRLDFEPVNSRLITGDIVHGDRIFGNEDPSTESALIAALTQSKGRTAAVEEGWVGSVLPEPSPALPAFPAQPQSAASATPKASTLLECAFHNSPSEAHVQLQLVENVLGVRGEPTERLCDPEAGGDLVSQLETRRLAVEDVQRVMLRHRIHQQKIRDDSVRPTPGFNIGDKVMLIRPPSDKLMSGAVAPYVVVTKEPTGTYYSVTILGPDGEPTGLPTRVAGTQLRRFDVEWTRLQADERGSGNYPTKAAVGHRRSKTKGLEGDLEFGVIWITKKGVETTSEPAQLLTGNAHFKEYWEAAGLTTSVRKRVQRERRRGLEGSSG
jgi:hypothetical protein